MQYYGRVIWSTNTVVNRCDSAVYESFKQILRNCKSQKVKKKKKKKKFKLFIPRWQPGKNELWQKKGLQIQAKSCDFILNPESALDAILAQSRHATTTNAM